MTITRNQNQYAVHLTGNELIELVESLKDRLFEAKQLKKSQSKPSPELLRRLEMIQEMRDEGNAFVTKYGSRI